MAVVSKLALDLLYEGESPPGTIYYEKKSVREFFTTDLEVILQVKTCSKGPNLRQGIPPVLKKLYGRKRSKKGAKLRICSPAIFSLQDTTGGGCISQYSYFIILEIVCMYMNRFINM